MLQLTIFNIIYLLPIYSIGVLWRYYTSTTTTSIVLMWNLWQSKGCCKIFKCMAREEARMNWTWTCTSTLVRDFGSLRCASTLTSCAKGAPSIINNTQIWKVNLTGHNIFIDIFLHGIEYTVFMEIYCIHNLSQITWYSSTTLSGLKGYWEPDRYVADVLKIAWTAKPRQGQNVVQTILTLAC